MNSAYRKPLPGTRLDYFDAREAVNAIRPGAWEKLPYTARVHAENIVRRAEPAIIEDCLRQIVEIRRERDFPWFPARVVCHDILGQTALVDLAGLRDAIAEQGGDPAKVNPVVPVPAITRAVNVEAMNSCSAYRLSEMCIAFTHEAGGGVPCSMCRKCPPTESSSVSTSMRSPVWL